MQYRHALVAYIHISGLPVVSDWSGDVPVADNSIEI